MGAPLPGKAPRIVTFTVEGAGSFPLDMLRYDRCFPRTETDSNVAADRGTRRRVTLLGLDYPTVGRWESFNWKIVEVEGKPVL